MFKVTSQLSNVRSPKSTEPIVETTPTNGNLKLNAPACEKIGVTNKEYIAIVKGKINEDAEEAIYIVKGHKDGEKQFGSRLASPGDKDGGTLQFSSENAYKALGGCKEEKKQYTVTDGVESSDGNVYFELVFKGSIEKVERKTTKKELAHK